MISWLKKLINFVLPPRCLICNKQTSSYNTLCPECFHQINFIVSPYCAHCGTPLIGVDLNSSNLLCALCLDKKDIFRLRRAAFLYDESSKKILLDFKFADHVENKKLLSQWLYWAGKDIFDAGVDLIIPVPLHYTRLFKRKYNQSALLANELSRLSGIPANFSCLRKTKRTLPQVLCNQKKRTSNLRDAFTIFHSELIKGKRIVLIDDVYTTGSTVRECAKMLKKAGAKSIDALTVAKV